MRHMIDTLESRRLMAATLANGVLTVTGTNGNDIIELDRKTATELKVEIGTSEQKFDFTKITRIVVNALGGNDIVEVNQRNTIPFGVEIHGGDGRDTIEGSLGPDKIFGESGNDVLEGRDGNDTISGGTHNDRIQGQDGNDVLMGDSGNDWIQGGRGNDNISGGNGDDDLWGNGGGDIFHGGRGNDDFYDFLEIETHDRKREDRGDNLLFPL